MRLPVNTTAGYEGSTLVLDNTRELLSVISPVGEVLGTVSWASVIDLVRSQREGDDDRAAVQGMVPLALTVHYHAAGALSGEGLTAEFGGGGFFLETGTPLPVGTELTIEFSLPDQPHQPGLARHGRVYGIGGRAGRAGGDRHPWLRSSISSRSSSWSW